MSVEKWVSILTIIVCLSVAGTSSVGSTTIFNSIAAGVFDHKRHLSPLLDMSERSMHLQKSFNELEQSCVQRTISEYSSNKSSPRDAISSARSSKSQVSPRELPSQMSSATEYDTLPHRNDGSQSTSAPAHLMLSPDLAQRVSNILNQSSSPVVPKLTFADVSPTYKQLSSSFSSPREVSESHTKVSTDSSPTLSHDELDQHVSEVLRRSNVVLEATNPTAQLPPSGDDHSYLSKYMSPQTATGGTVKDSSYNGYSAQSRGCEVSPGTTSSLYRTGRLSSQHETDSSNSSSPADGYVATHNLNPLSFPYIWSYC